MRGIVRGRAGIAPPGRFARQQLGGDQGADQQDRSADDGEASEAGQIGGAEVCRADGFR
jgi:hypothetical protein